MTTDLFQDLSMLLYHFQMISFGSLEDTTQQMLDLMIFGHLMYETEPGVVHLGRTKTLQIIKKLLEMDPAQEQILLPFFSAIKFISLAVMEDTIIKELPLMIFIHMI